MNPEAQRRDLTETEERRLMLGHLVEIHYRSEQSIRALLAGQPLPTDPAAGTELVLLRGPGDEDED
jgi:hypothetical protein